MNDLRDSLRDGDPLLREPALGEGDILVMRRRVLDAARIPKRRHVAATAVLAAAACAMTGVAIGAVVHLSGQPGLHTKSGHTVTPPSEDGRDVRRVYFETPSGVRVIWQFESE